MPDHNDSPRQARILLLDDDLFFSARILSVLQKLGHGAEAVRTREQAIVSVRQGCDLAIVNFGSIRFGDVEVIREIREAGAPKLLAFLSHVKIPAVRDAVLAAGADRIVPNSAISQRLPEILARLLANEPLTDDIDDGD